MSSVRYRTRLGDLKNKQSTESHVCGDSNKIEQWIERINPFSNLGVLAKRNNGGLQLGKRLALFQMGKALLFIFAHAFQA